GGKQHQPGHHHRQPDLRSRAAFPAQRDVRLQAAGGRQHPPQGQRDGRVGRQAELLRRHRLGRAGREQRPLPLQGPARGDRRPPRVARVAGPAGQQAPVDRHHRRHRAVPRRPRRGRALRRRLRGAVGHPGRHERLQRPRSLPRGRRERHGRRRHPLL
ncbi:MAG: Single-stranded DNA-binding protein, partial [uncultured Solirubrobacteraceae bacterium]